MRVIRINNIIVVGMSLLLGVFILLILFRLESDLNQFKQLNQGIMDKQAEISANVIAREIDDIRQRMSAIAKDNLLIEDLQKFKDIENIQSTTFDRLKSYFPKVVGFSLSDQHAERLGGDFAFVLGDACRNDLVETGKNQSYSTGSYEPWLHAHADGYHFDMILPIVLFGEQVMFFISFKGEVLRNILREMRISEHYSYLVRRDVQGLIEVSSQGVRNSAEFDHQMHLSQEELNSIKAREVIPGTRWELVVIPEVSTFNTFKQSRINDSMMLIGVFFVLWLIALFFVLKYEAKRINLIKNLKHLSDHDGLTGLANRRVLEGELDNTLQRFSKQGEYAAVLFMDLDSFKPVNDQLGHAIGDKVLCEVATRLKSCSRETDVVVRLGGDEFVVVLNRLGTQRKEACVSLKTALNRFNDALNKSYCIEGNVLDTPTSIGVLLVDGRLDSVAEIIKKADELMYDAKNKNTTTDIAGCS